MIFIDLNKTIFNTSTSVLEDTKCDSNHHQLITSSEAVYVLLIATLTSLTLFTVLANGVILLALARSRLFQRLRLGPAQGEGAVTVMLMVAMAFADLALGIAVMPLMLAEVVENVRWEHRLEMYRVRGCLSVIWCTISMYNMTSLAVDRKIHHMKQVLPVNSSMKGVTTFSETKGRKKSSLTILNRFETKTGLYPSHEISLSSENTPISVINSADLMMDKSELYKNVSNSLQPVSWNKKNYNYGTQKTLMKADIADSSSSKPAHTNVRVKAERTLALMVVCFVVCWLPMSIATTISYFMVSPLPTWTVLLVTWMGYSNSALNPVLFCFHRDVREAVKSLLHFQ
ncbi:hypothetical protein Btru_072616 [Bulinus truncatus]|nr:hypothetical protein Btru_072616 [Bulinus truncatus]